jgi:hypothetical protein
VTAWDREDEEYWAHLGDYDRAADRILEAEGTTLYAIWCRDTDYVKIGIAKDADERLRKLQTGCPYELEIVRAVRLPMLIAAAAVERLLHALLAPRRGVGEWFRFDTDAVGEFDETVKRYVHLRPPEWPEVLQEIEDTIWGLVIPF